ncbi:hypothetical protein BGZ47_003045 [Haplosporangium gracile]|nr:hypothetical protein BGZ47_003045 [Haplosporangium gracile]
MSRATNAPTRTPPTSPEAEVKLEKVSTKEKKVSSKSTSTSRQDNQKDVTSATSTTTLLSPRTTPAPQEMPTLKSHQTRRQCSGLKSDKAQCLKVCTTGYPNDVSFFCKNHVDQADFQAAASPVISTPAISRQAESKDKGKVDDKTEDHKQGQGKIEDKIKDHEDKDNEEEGQSPKADAKKIYGSMMYQQSQMR